MNILISMNLVLIYAGLADANRLRIMNLLTGGALGVKHLQGILGISQVRVSKHLGYLKKRGLVEADRSRNWMLYRLPANPSFELRAQVKALVECAQAIPILRSDLAARQSIQDEVERVMRLPSRAEVGGVEAPQPLAPAVGQAAWGLREEDGYVD